ncbi:hypothetical protein Sjap_005009 [Stephania japonica]|uniref:Uncharacterized protein n=1 Tax=Stephania japonica TaxID=461633 RepID=A0AAP0PLF5_9MAGN
MAAFFDFNVPYLEGFFYGSKSNKQQSLPDTNPNPNPNAKKNTRLKIAVKAMELGYSGIAYNRSIKGVMSDSDKCAISLFPLPSLLKLAPSMDATVKFHRALLGLPLNAPFRQYSRLTLVVDSMVQIAALNTGNPVLKTYDLVAVRPLNQTVFDHACKSSEVDLIAIDFSLKLPFRLKLPMVKAAIERGVYFEITYAPFISDVQTRRQVVANAKLLVDWTRGKNLIFSSAAASVNEIRGPNDVANLSSLLGLSMERAKAAISKNCRSLIASALRKKQFYKETIKVEKISYAMQKESEEPWFVDVHNWDPISSNEGDILFDDIAKLCSTTSKLKTSKAIDFSSISHEMESNGVQLKDWLSDVRKLPMEDTSSLSSVVKESMGMNNEFRLLPNDISITSTDSEDMGRPTSSCERHANPSGAVSASLETCLQDIPQDSIFALEKPLISDDAAVEPMSSSDANSISVETQSHNTLSQYPEATLEQNLILGDVNSESHSTAKENEDSLELNKVDAVLGTMNERMEKITSVLEERNQTDGDHMSVDRDLPPSNFHMLHTDDVVPVADDKMVRLSNGEMQAHVTSLAVDMQSEGAVDLLKDQKHETLVEVNMLPHKESISGKARSKQRSHLRALPFPLKSLLKPVVFKKKPRNPKIR